MTSIEFYQNVIKIQGIRPAIKMKYWMRSFCTMQMPLGQKVVESRDSLTSEEKFRVMELTMKKTARRARRNQYETFFKQPREQIQPIHQDWTSVWPGIRSFHPATVPIPIRMGFPNKGSTPPEKWGNAELMKIPNFLHLTPPAIEKHCAAIKKFCTPWPEELASEEAQNYFYPLRVKTSTYLHSSPTLRDPRSRAVTLSVLVESLDLDNHALDKLLRLVGERYDPKTKILTLESDRCPLNVQNRDYCIYLLTVLYNESLKTEPWEHEKQDSDYEIFDYERSKSKEKITKLQEVIAEPLSEEAVDEYKSSLGEMHNEGETEETVNAYKDAVLKLLKIG